MQLRLVAIPTSSTPSTAAMARAAGSASSGMTPSRQSPISTMRMTLWVRPWATAARPRARTVSTSELRLICASDDHLVRLALGRQAEQQDGRVDAGARSRRMLSRRDSASLGTPPASIARAMSGSPQQHLVTPATWMPCWAHMATTASALRRMPSQSTSILIP